MIKIKPENFRETVARFHFASRLRAVLPVRVRFPAPGGTRSQRFLYLPAGGNACHH